MPRPRRSPEPDRFRYERELIAGGRRFIAGIDEAGRGPLAGPVVAACVILPGAWIEEGIPESLKLLNDSKQLSELQREEFFELIVSNPDIHHSIAECDAQVIDSINILQATHRAMNLALAGMKCAVEHALVDGRPVKTLSVTQTALVKGDSLSYSIAAGSVLAKVSRDRQMLEWHERHPEYGFAEHKGYGTPKHLAAIAEHGPCSIHRLSFAPLKLVQKELF